MSVVVTCSICGTSFYEGMNDEKSTSELIRVLNKRGGFYCLKHAKYKEEDQEKKMG